MRRNEGHENTRCVASGRMDLDASASQIHGLSDKALRLFASRHGALIPPATGNGASLPGTSLRRLLQAVHRHPHLLDALLQCLKAPPQRHGVANAIQTELAVFKDEFMWPWCGLHPHNSVQWDFFSHVQNELSCPQIALFILVNKAIYSCIRERILTGERDALVACGRQLGAATLEGWEDLYISTNLEQQWSDISGNHVDGITTAGWCAEGCTQGVYVSEIDLSDQDLTGALPNSLGLFRNLKTILLASNQLAGNIPQELDQLPSLQKCYLNDNQLSGIGLPDWTKLLNLEVLLLDHNKISGELPVSFIRMAATTKQTAPQIHYIHDEGLAHTNCHWSAATHCGGGTHCGVEDNCGLSLPIDLCQLDDVTTMYLSRYILTGGIPDSIGDIKTLVILDLSSNKLTGKIPKTIGHLLHLEWLNLSSNLLTGCIPDSIGLCTRLRLVNLSGNQLDGTEQEREAKVRALVPKLEAFGANHIYPETNPLDTSHGFDPCCICHVCYQIRIDNGTLSERESRVYSERC